MDETNTEYHRPLILVVDDDRAIRLSLKRFLETEEYGVVEAENGGEALERFRDSRPDLILMDVSMPNMDGCEACELIKRETAGKKTPVLMVTAHNDEDSIERAYASGAIDYVPKPIYWAALKNRLRAILESQANQNKLADLNNQYQSLLNSVAEGICRVDEHKKILYANPAIAQMLGRERKSILGEHIETFLEKCEDDEAGLDLEITAGGQFHLREAQLRRGDGTSLNVAVTRAPLVENEEIKGCVFIILDITERKYLERSRVRASRMEATETMAGGIAHDFNNLMTIVLGNIDLLQRDIGAEGGAVRKLQTMARSARRAAELAQQLIAYARGGKYRTEPLDLNRLMGPLPFDRWAGDMEPVTNIVRESGLRLIEADADQVRQVVKYLFQNAVESMLDNVRNPVITLTTRTLNLGAEFPGRPEDCPPGPYVCLGVTDTGCGMEASVRLKAIEPFYSSKFQGRGLGLSAVHGIVRNHKGFVILESEPGLGTLVQVYFPAS